MTDPNMPAGKARRQVSFRQFLVGGLVAGVCLYHLAFREQKGFATHDIIMGFVAVMAVSVMFVDLTRFFDWSLSMVRAWRGNTPPPGSP